ATTITSIVDPAVVVKQKVVKPSLFTADSSSAGGADPNTGIFSDLTESDFLVSGVRTVIDPDTDLQKVYVPRWSVTNGSRLDDGPVLITVASMSLSAEKKKNNELDVKVVNLAASVKVREQEVVDLDAVVASVKS
ncbi:hypothetical protein Tco_0148649, partial [Tanacetum coccineum]